MNGKDVVAKLVKKMVSMHLDINKAKILVVGVGDNDMENEFHYDTDIIDILKELQEYDIKTHLFDPCADKDFLKEEYGIHCENNMIGFGIVSTYSGFIITQYSNMFNIGEYKRGRFAIIQL